MHWRRLAEPMSPEAEAIWNSPKGVRLLHKVLRGLPTDEQDAQTVQALKQSGKGPPANPANAVSPESPESPEGPEGPDKANPT